MAKLKEHSSGSGNLNSDYGEGKSVDLIYELGRCWQTTGSLLQEARDRWSRSLVQMFGSNDQSLCSTALLVTFKCINTLVSMVVL